LLTPCFPLTDEPGLTVEIIVLTQGTIVGQLREKYIVRDKFFNADGTFKEFQPEGVRLKKFNADLGQFDVSEDEVAQMTLSKCAQFSYFA
jgi:hypothetical protein